MKYVLQQFSFALALIVAVAAGCSVGPNYKRPSTNPPATFRRAASDKSPNAGTNSFADQGWWCVYDDPQLRAYITEALTNSTDIQIAAARVLQAEAVAHITRSQYFPEINAGGEIQSVRFSQRNGDFPLGIQPQSTFGSVNIFSPSYEVDLW